MAGLAEPLVRPLQRHDWPEVVEAYADAVQTLALPFYQPEQIDAWAHHPLNNPSFEAALDRGFGLVGTTPDRPASVEAFALLDPSDRLALLYCRARSSRKGLATKLVRSMEQQARSSGHSRLRTEASQLSRPLLERLGWSVDGEENILFAGVPFLRWRMSQTLI
ncbi:MAG: GNAT family N-acetyltransferase [Cyanobacteriota bacterium]|nr:GNAT family N-acetyltransferase [Cyanobacteriota bacterium]